MDYDDRFRPRIPNHFGDFEELSVNPGGPAIVRDPRMVTAHWKQSIEHWQRTILEEVYNPIYKMHREKWACKFGDLYDIDANHMVHARQDNCGDDDHRIVPQRQAGFLDPVQYEIIKMSPVLNPHFELLQKSIVFNKLPDGSEHPLKDAMVSMLKIAEFPKIQNPATVAPFLRSKHGFSSPEAKQPKLFQDVFGLPELMPGILRHIFAESETLSNLSRTCKFVFRRISECMMHWDVRGKNFLLCDKPMFKLQRLVKEGKMTEKELNNVVAGEFLIVSPIRGDITFGPKSIQALQGLPDYDTGVYDLSDTTYYVPDFTEQLLSLRHMFRAMFYQRDYLRYVKLFDVPYLDVAGVTAILNSCPNLESLCIESCLLIHLGHVKELVDLVYDYSKKHDRNLQFDVVPRYHHPRGPRMGDYGVVFRDPEEFDAIRGVMGILVGLVPHAMDKGVDLLSPGKGFRKFLDQIPFPVGAIPDIVEVLAQLGKFSQERHPWPHEDHYEHWCARRRTLYADLWVLTDGKPVAEKLVDKMEFYQCGSCMTYLPRWYEAVCAPCCVGCRLRMEFKNESDHMKWHKVRIAANIWRHLWDNLSLDWVEGTGPPPNFNTKKVKECQRAFDRAEEMMHYHEEAIQEMTKWIGHITWRDPNYHEAKKEYEMHKNGIKLNMLYQNRQYNCRGLEGMSDWDFIRRSYYNSLGMESGLLQNNGPHPGYAWQTWMNR